jgi:hypothetical protein
MPEYWNTRLGAIAIGVTPNALQRAVWDGRVVPPPKGPSGNYLWRREDLDRASWALLHRPFEPSEQSCQRAAQ